MVLLCEENKLASELQADVILSEVVSSRQDQPRKRWLHLGHLLKGPGQSVLQLRVLGWSGKSDERMICVYSNAPLTEEAAHGVCNKHRGLGQRNNDMRQVIVGLSIGVGTSRLVTAGAMASEADSKAVMTM